MTEEDRKFWPYPPRTSVLSGILLLIGLLLLVAILRATIGWPSEASETAVLIGILVVGLLPILLSLVDIVIERGGVIEYGGMKVDFSQVPQKGISGLTVPVNIGVSGEPINDK